MEQQPQSMWPVAPLRARRSSGGQLGEPQAGTVGGSCARLSQGHGTKRGTAAGPTGTHLWLQACSMSWGRQRGQSTAQGRCKGGSTDRSGCKGSVSLVRHSHGTRMPQASPRIPVLGMPAGRDGACQMHQHQEEFAGAQGHQVLVLGIVPRTGPGHGLRAGQSVMTCQGQSAVEEEHATRRLR